ncbi:MAG: response regulator [Gammaproteobacteria bacterium]|nr:response regulator [Gammaproteobacteria bacterium]MBU1645062.1 response regulator [Gammaproteobacteria bacterium]MBU1973299.1 response regulator [Gammaproteobacteria bacterium]
MRPLGLNLRVLLAAVLPAALVAVALAAIFTARQVASLEEALLARGRAEARQLASNAEFGLFSGNRDFLERAVRNLSQADGAITGVAVIDAGGAALVRQGLSVLPEWPPIGEERDFLSGETLVVVTPIRREVLAVEDIYSGFSQPAAAGRISGLVVLELSRAPLLRERFYLLLATLIVALFGLIVGGVLAVRIARGVTRPVLHISDVVRRIAAGDLQARVTPDAGDAVRQLEHGINDMAQRIASAQGNLREQITAATAELRQRKDEAEEVAATKSRFLASASHDLRQPMHALGLFVSRLGRMSLDHEAHGVVRYIESSVSVMQDLLDTLLDISRIDAGLVTPTLAPVAVSRLFDRLEIELAESIRRKGLEFRRHGGEGLWLLTDAALLERILMNLLSNAGRYTQRGGVLLACRRRGDAAWLEVWDTGIGIPLEAQRTVFQEYMQLGNPERDRAKGLGLGLSICERLARLLRTPLRMQSRPGYGSVFRIEVPLAAGVPEPAVAPAVAEMVGMSGTVLIVDDDPLVLASTTQLVASWGCRTFAAASVAEVMGECDAAGCRPDAAICDYRLRGFENGVHTARTLRLRYGDLPVLLLSGDLTDSVREAAERHQLALLGKPMKPARLRALLQSMLNQGPG